MHDLDHANAKRPSALLLDRDGVINRKPPEDRWVSSWEEFNFLPGALEALAVVAAAGIRTIVITNQRGVARGAVSVRALQQIHDRMRAEIAAAGGRIDAVYYCPHEGGCACRKPGTALLQRAARELGIELSRSVLIGDRLSDIQAGAAVRAATILVSSEAEDPLARILADHIAADLGDAVRWVLACPRPHASFDQPLESRDAAEFPRPSDSSWTWQGRPSDCRCRPTSET